MKTDPRGPFRVVVSVETTPETHEVTFECGHIGYKNRTMTAPEPGERVRCFDCRESAR